jgi:hypothetical protein
VVSDPKISRSTAPGDFPLRSRAASRSVIFVDQHLQSCGISFVYPIYKNDTVPSAFRAPRASVHQDRLKPSRCFRDPSASASLFRDLLFRPQAGLVKVG